MACRLQRARRRDADPARKERKRTLYDASHRASRRIWAPLVDDCKVKCWRCKRLILPGDEWDLGHRDGLPSAPEHARECNRAHANQNRS